MLAVMRVDRESRLEEQSRTAMETRKQRWGVNRAGDVLWRAVVVGVDDAVVVELEVGLDDVLVELVGLGGGVAHVLVVLPLLLVLIIVVVDVIRGPRMRFQIQHKKGDQTRKEKKQRIGAREGRGRDAEDRTLGAAGLAEEAAAADLSEGDKGEGKW